MSQELTRAGWLRLPLFVPRSVVRRWTGLRDDQVTELAKKQRLRTLPSGPTGKQVVYNRLDLGELIGYRE